MQSDEQDYWIDEEENLEKEIYTVVGKTMEAQLLEVQKEILLTNQLLWVKTLEKTELKFKDFLLYLLDNLVVQNRTYFANTSIPQCEVGMHRSTKEIFLLCRYYFPRVTLKKTILTLMKLLDEDLIDSVYCGGIKKRTWYQLGSRGYSTDSTDLDNYNEDEEQEHKDENMTDFGLYTIFDYIEFYNKKGKI
jgi:hypothetical protein